MWRLLLIYLLVLVLPRLLRGIREGCRTAPKRREKGPYFPIGEEKAFTPEAEKYPEEPREVMPMQPRRHRPPLSTRRKGESVSLELAKEKEPEKEVLMEKVGRPPLPSQSAVPVIPVARGLLSRPEAWVQGIIMSEILQPPRAKRPWRPVM